MADLDKKFKIAATSRKSGASYTEEDGVFFKAADPAFLDILEGYPEACRRRGCDPLQVISAGHLLARIREFQSVHGFKLPDVSREETHLLKPTNTEV